MKKIFYILQKNCVKIILEFDHMQLKTQIYFF
jgi:hypothetical protein